MAFPITRSAIPGTQTANSSSWTMTYPGAGEILDGGGSAIVAGDLILISGSRDGISGTPSISGYTSLFVANAGSAAKGYSFVKIADGTESGTFTFTPGASEQGAWRIAVIKDWYGVISGGVEVSIGATAASTTPNPDSITPSWGLADTYFRACCAYDDGRTSISAYPTNYSIYQNSDTSGGSGGSGFGSAGRQLTASSDDPGTFTKTGTGSANAWIAWTIAIRPAEPPLTVDQIMTGYARGVNPRAY